MREVEAIPESEWTSHLSVAPKATQMLLLKANCWLAAWIVKNGKAVRYYSLSVQIRFPRAEWRLHWIIFILSGFLHLPKQQHVFHFKGNTETKILVCILKCTNISLCSVSLLPGNQNFATCFLSVRSLHTLIAHPFSPALNRQRSYI